MSFDYKVADLSLAEVVENALLGLKLDVTA
jgi:hypothetical protein